MTFSLSQGGSALTATGTAVLQSGVASVDVTNGGSGYTSAPTVTFGAAPSGGVTAAGSADMRYGVASVDVTNGGSGYTSPPTVTFGAAASGGTTAAGTAVLRLSSVASVTVTNGGSGYPVAPTVTFSAPAGGTRATGTAKLAESGYDQYQNLYWARQTLAGKQLLVRLADTPTESD